MLKGSGRGRWVAVAAAVIGIGACAPGGGSTTTREPSTTPPLVTTTAAATTTTSTTLPIAERPEDLLTQFNRAMRSAHPFRLDGDLGYADAVSREQIYTGELQGLRDGEGSDWLHATVVRVGSGETFEVEQRRVLGVLYSSVQGTGEWSEVTDPDPDVMESILAGDLRLDHVTVEEIGTGYGVTGSTTDPEVADVELVIERGTFRLIEATVAREETAAEFGLPVTDDVTTVAITEVARLRAYGEPTTFLIAPTPDRYERTTLAGLLHPVAVDAPLDGWFALSRSDLDTLENPLVASGFANEAGEILLVAEEEVDTDAFGRITVGQYADLVFSQTEWDTDSVEIYDGFTLAGEAVVEIYGTMQSRLFGGAQLLYVSEENVATQILYLAPVALFDEHVAAFEFMFNTFRRLE